MSQEIEKVRKEIKFFELNIQSASVHMIWDTFKAYVRGVYVQVKAKIKNEQRK